MAGTNLQDTALIAASGGGSDIMRIVQKDHDGANPTTDVLGASGGHVYQLWFKRTSQIGHDRPISVFNGEDGEPLAAIRGNRTIRITGEIGGNALNMEKIFLTKGVYWKVGDYEPQKTGYLKRVFNLCVANVTFGPRRAGEAMVLTFEFVPVVLESATVDAAGVGGYVYTPTEIATSALAAIASATDV